MRALLARLREPALEGISIDGQERIVEHEAILRRKRMVREVFGDCHARMRELAAMYLPAEGVEVEIGAGVAPIRQSDPSVLSTDLVLAPGLDFVTDAQQLALRSGSVRVVYAQNAFHHLPQPQRFLRELERVLAPRGGAVLLEPYHGPVASFLFKRLFATEGFDKSFPAWETPMEGPMHGANQALSYIVFVRDRERFESEFPALEIVHRSTVPNYVRYLVSGGLNFRQLLPDAAILPLRALEWLLRPLGPLLALHQVIVLRKKAG
jgi:SAM-dependent methyltransferase